MGRYTVAFSSAALLLSLCGCPQTGPIFQGSPGGTAIDVQTVVAGADFPTALAVVPDGRLFYTEKATGQVRVVTAGGDLLTEPFVSVPAVSNSERGLLGIVLHPDFTSNGWVYLYYTRSASGQVTGNGSDVLDNRVVRFTAAGNVAAGPETLIISLPAMPGPNHDGGHMAFGPDGKLFVSIGDQAASANSQNLSALPGRIHRLNDDGSIPADNPFGSNNSTFALGLRNSFSITFDPVSGTLFGTENGTNSHDEVNRIVAGGNYGWPVVQGTVATPPAVAAGTYVNPIVDYSSGSVVPTGIAFAPDATFGSAVAGGLFVGQFATGQIIRYTLDSARSAVVGETVFADSISGGITDLKFAPDGTLYVATGTAVLHIVPVQ